MSKLHAVLASAAVFGLLSPLSIPDASADVFTSVINVPNSDLTGFTGPYAAVTISTPSPNSSTAIGVFTSLSNGGNTYLLGGANAVDLNVNAATYTVSSIAGTSNAGFNLPSLSSGGAGTVDAFGSFNLTLNDFDGFTSAATQVSFALTDTSGTFATASSVLAANAGGFDAAIHAFVCANPCAVTEGAKATGFAAERGGVAPPSVPEPASLAMLGSALAGFGIFLRRRRD